MQSPQAQAQSGPAVSPRRPERGRFIIVGVVLVAAIVAATGVVVQMQRLAAIDDFRTATRNLGNGMARQSAHSIAVVDEALDRIVVTIGAIRGPDATDGATAARLQSPSMRALLAAQAGRLAMVDALWVTDASGRIVNNASASPIKTVDVSGSDYFRHLRGADERTVFVGVPDVDPASGRGTVPLARRINDAQGRFAGVAVAAFSLTDLAGFFRLAMPPHRAVSVVRGDGLILLRFPRRADETGTRIPESSPWYGARDLGGGTYLAPDYFDSAPVIASVHQLDHLPVFVEASVAQADALAHWQGNLAWNALGGLLAAACVIILLRLYARQYQRIALSERSLSAKNVEIEAAHQQLNETLANLSQGVCLYGDDKKLLVFNQRFCWLYDLPAGTVSPGMTKEEIVRLRAAMGTFPRRDIEGYLAMIDRAITESKPLEAVEELPNGKSIAFHFQPLPGRRWITTHEDITKRVEAEARVTFLAGHDFLTGLANRNSFQERLDAAFEEAKRGKSFAVFCLDLDRFKVVNDSFGHPVGDALLRSITERLLALVRKVDVVARLGGDEFAILLPGMPDTTVAAAVAQRIVERLKEPFAIEGHNLMVGISIGIVMSRGGEATPDQLMKDGDLALYRAKHEGRGTWRFFEAAIDTATPA